MQTLTAPVWLLAVLGVLAVVGFVAVFWVAAGWAERAADWWHERRARRRREQPRGISDDCWFGTHEDCDGCDCVCGHPAFALEELPPERTWEQMTNHQLPVVGAVVKPPWPFGFPPEHPERFAPARERRAPWWEAEHRAAYESLGFDYPSGLMARVRELTP